MPWFSPDRVAHIETRADRFRREVRGRRDELGLVAIGHVAGETHVVWREVRLGHRHAIHLAVLPGVEIDRDTAASAEEVRVGVVAAEDERLRLRVTDAAAELRGRTFFDFVVDVDEVGGTGDRLGFRLDLLDVRQALEALLRAIERGVRKPAAFQLAHFTAQHFVVDLGDAVENDVAHVDAVARIDEERERELLVLGVTHGGGHRIDLGECEAVFTETVLQQLLRGGDDLARESVAGLHEQVAPQQRFGHRRRCRRASLP